MSNKLISSMGSDVSTVTSNDYNPLDEQFDDIFKDMDSEVDITVGQLKQQLINNSNNINESLLLKQSLDYCLKKLTDLSISEEKVRQSLDLLDDFLKVFDKTFLRLLDRRMKTIIKEIYIENRLNSYEIQERRLFVVTLLTRSTASYGNHMILTTVGYVVRIVDYFWRELEDGPQNWSNVKRNTNMYYILMGFNQIIANLLDHIESQRISVNDFNYLKPRLDLILSQVNYDLYLTRDCHPIYDSVLYHIGMSVKMLRRIRRHHLMIN